MTDVTKILELIADNQRAAAALSSTLTNIITRLHYSVKELQLSIELINNRFNHHQHNDDGSVIEERN